jgi:hypothetical protein
LEEQFPKLGLNIQTTMLCNKKKISIKIAKGTIGHIRIDHENVQRDAFSEVWISAAAQSVKSINEIDPFAGWRERERRPFGLLHERLYLGVDGQEAVFNLSFGADIIVVSI